MRASRIQTVAQRGSSWLADYRYAVRQIATGLVRRKADWASSGAGGEVPVLLIPGIYESWRFLEPLAQRLLAAGHPVHVVRELGLNPDPPVGLACGSVWGRENAPLTWEDTTYRRSVSPVQKGHLVDATLPHPHGVF